MKQIGPAGQKKISQATVMIAGCGGLGTNVANQLTRMGVKKLILVDPDIVSLTNLHRQSLFTEKDAQQKRLKVEVAKEKLRQFNSEVEIETLPRNISKELINQYNFDLLITALDNFKTRISINDWAIKKNFDYIFASCSGTLGEVMMISPRQHPCLNCLFPDFASLRQASSTKQGINTPLVNLIASCEVSLAQHYFIDKTSIDYDHVLVTDNWYLSFNRIKVKKNENCPSCSQEKREKES